MKFTTSDNNTYRQGVGNVSKAWIDYGLNHRESIEEYFYKNIKIYDADTAGYHTVDFLFEDDTAYRLSYDWYCNTSGEQDDWGEEPWIIDEYDIEQINRNDLNIQDTKQRDWI